MFLSSADCVMPKPSCTTKPICIVGRSSVIFAFYQYRRPGYDQQDWHAHIYLSERYFHRQKFSPTYFKHPSLSSNPISSHLSNWLHPISPNTFLSFSYNIYFIAYWQDMLSSYLCQYLIYSFVINSLQTIQISFYILYFLRKEHHLWHSHIFNPFDHGDREARLVWSWPTLLCRRDVEPAAVHKTRLMLLNTDMVQLYRARTPPYMRVAGCH